MRRLVALMVLALALASCSLRGAYPAGPYRGRVVDADTKEPLVGAVVLMSWFRMAPGLGHASSSFLDAEEVLTDERGEFVVGRSAPINLMPLTWMREPDLTIFQPGYGYFPQHYVTVPSKPPTGFKGTLELMEKQTVVFELPRLKTWQERRISALLVDPLTIPSIKNGRLLEALNHELLDLNLTPIRPHSR